MKLVISVFAASLSIILAYLSLVNPFNLAPINFLPIIAAVYAFSFASLYLGISIFYERIQNSHVRAVSFLLAFTPTALFALSTLNRLSAIEVVLIVLIPVIITWYYLRTKR